MIGQTLGHYHILEKLGSGGMGEVYRARDERLAREVAIKVLPPAFSRDKERLRRFEQEARAAAALNHPNIVAIYDIGMQDGSPYIVSELLEGETLRKRIISGALPVRTAINYAVQIARGLSAAHEKQIVHRDLKPENVFVTKDGRVKILDFGLAKLIGQPAAPTDTGAAVTVSETSPGTVLGTLGYMSPEQLRGQAVDHRSDLFSFGAILLEMLTGKRAFQGDTPADTISAILKEEPSGLVQPQPSISPMVTSILRHCLEKNPEERFQSARDLAFHLEALSSLSEITGPVSTPAVAEREPAKRTLRLVLAGLTLLGMMGFGLLLGRGTGSRPPPSYHQLTFHRGTIWSARFASDTHTIVYSAAWSGKPLDIFSTRAGTTESRSLGLADADLLAVSSSGEMAVLLNRHHLGHLVGRGTLARVSLAGGAPREILEDVQQADWSPDGRELAVVRYSEGQNRLEYPIGKTLYATFGWISYPRISPKGDRVAFLEHRAQWDNRGWVSVVDLVGNKKQLSGEWAVEEGLAWSADGNEVWFSASKAGEANAVFAVTLSRKERVVARAPTNLTLHDIARDGTVLITAYKFSTPIIGLPPGETKERDLSWLDGVGLYDLSADGKTFIFQYYGEGSGTNYASYLGKTDGSPAVRLGDGAAIALSPDEKWVLSILNLPRQTVLLPTGAGEAKRLERPGIEEYGDDGWFPDGKHVLFTGRESGKALRGYIQNIDGGSPRPVTPEGITGTLISPDGKLLLVRDSEGKRFLFSIEGGKSRPVPNLDDAEIARRWSADGRSLYVYRGTEVPVKLRRLDLSSGRKEILTEIAPSDPAGIVGSLRVFLTPNGKWYVYQFVRYLSELYVVKGLN